MNKTININLGGFFFHMDETAYLKLKRYLDAVSRSLSEDPQGKNEIIADIEARISELLSEKITDERQVVNESDIEDIIAIMGQPEDYADAEEGYSQSSYSYKRNNVNRKKLFRDGEDKFLGGVCSGIGYYLNLDVIWVRIAFILLTASGFTPLIYIVLWILLPEATTTAEKLQMEGEPVNIDNIEKKIREEFTNASEKIKNGANEISDKVKDAANNVSEKVGNSFKKKKKKNSGLEDILLIIGRVFTVLFKIIGKIIGVLLIFISSVTVLALIIGMFSVGGFEAFGLEEQLNYPPIFFDTIIPEWLLSILILLLVAIPFVGLFVLGLRILSNNVKQLNKTVSLSLLGVWIIALLIVVFSFIDANAAFTKAEVFTKKTSLELQEKDTLKLKMVNNDDLHFLYNFRRSSKKYDVDIDGIEKTYTNNIRVKIEKSKNDENYFLVKKQSYGKNRFKAEENAESISYQYNIENNTILLDAYFLSDFKTLHKDEKVTILFFLAEENTIYLDDSMASFLYGVRNDQNFYNSELTDHYFIMGRNELLCADCEEQEEENNNDDDETNL